MPTPWSPGGKVAEPGSSPGCLTRSSGDLDLGLLPQHPFFQNYIACSAYRELKMWLATSGSWFRSVALNEGDFSLRDIMQCLETFLVVVTRERILLASSRWRRGML